MMKTLSFVGCFAVLAGCGSKDKDAVSFLTNHAVGTYIGGASMFGSETCTYAGTPGVFQTDDGKPSADAEGGPRFVFAAGTITKECKSGHKAKVNALVPTGAKISGPSKLKVGDTNNMFHPHLVANGKELGGEAYVDWKLGNDCNGIAEFGPVLGAQDTGGKDRTRDLVTKGKGKCTVMLGLTTGTALAESFKPQTLQTELVVTIE